MSGYRCCGVVASALVVERSAWTGTARADDEIQVYTGEITDVGKWTAQHHFNYAIIGRKEPDFPGGLSPTTRSTPRPNSPMA